MKKLEAIIFDCDGILVDSEIIGLFSTLDFLKTVGYDVTPAFMIQRYTGMRNDVFAATLAADIAAARGKAVTEDEAKEIFDGLVACRRKDRDNMQAVDGAYAALTMLKPLCDRAGVGLAVASSTQIEYLENKLSKFDLKPFFGPHYYSAQLVAEGKPAPDIFLYAAQKLGAAPENCIVVEDSGNGVIAGKRANMQTYGLCAASHCFDGHAGMLTAAGADKVFDDYTQMMAQFNLDIG